MVKWAISVQNKSPVVINSLERKEARVEKAGFLHYKVVKMR
jgi:hypothetical protein